jgi:N-formylglutamate deformylase
MRREHSAAERDGGSMTEWLEVSRGTLPLIVSFPHTGTDIPADIERRLVSPWLARKDADWYVHQLYDMAQGLHATTVRTKISRTVIDVNRDPSGASLYPGHATTDLCPLTTFDGEPLYAPGGEPSAEEIAERRTRFFEPYHAAIVMEIERLRARHGYVVLYDAHSIRSRVPRLFSGELPHFNIGTYDGTTCDPGLTCIVEQLCRDPAFTCVTNGRFKGGWTTCHYGQPVAGVHAIQMELACRAYLDEPLGAVTPDNWPPPYDPTRAAAARKILGDILENCIEFVDSLPRSTV